MTNQRPRGRPATAATTSPARPTNREIRDLKAKRANLEDALLIDFPDVWQTFEVRFGPLAGPWVGHLKGAARRLELLAGPVLSIILRRRSPDWSAFVEVDDQGNPSTLTLEDGIRTRDVPIIWRNRSMVLGTKSIPFASKNAGDAIVITLAQLAAATFVIGPEQSPSAFALEEWFDGEPPA